MAATFQTIKGLTLIAGGWSDAAERFLEKIESDCPVSFYREEVTERGGRLFYVFTPENKCVGAVLLRMELTDDGKEMVIVAAGGQCAGRLMTGDVLTSLNAYAQTLGCASMRAHTKRRAVLAGFQRAGFALDEYVMRKDVA